MAPLWFARRALECHTGRGLRVSCSTNGRLRHVLSGSRGGCLSCPQSRPLLARKETPTRVVCLSSSAAVAPPAHATESVWFRRKENCFPPGVLPPFERRQWRHRFVAVTDRVEAPAYGARGDTLQQKLHPGRLHASASKAALPVYDTFVYTNTACYNATAQLLPNTFVVDKAFISGATVGNGKQGKGVYCESGPSGPEPSYVKISSGYHLLQSKEGFTTAYGGYLSKLDIAYETWGTLNDNKSNAVLLACGLSASSHAKSSPSNPQKGWWEDFIGSGLALDTDRFFVICVANLGSCYGTTGPSSFYRSSATEKPKRYGLRFPMFSVTDMVRVMFRVVGKRNLAHSGLTATTHGQQSFPASPMFTVEQDFPPGVYAVDGEDAVVNSDHLGIEALHAVVGSSLGGMQSLAAAVMYPHRVNRLVTISASAASSPLSIALRFAQRQVLMADPAFKDGEYYESAYPVSGMKLAREIATITYRSGPEWSQRFGRQRVMRGSGSSSSSSVCSRTISQMVETPSSPSLGIDFTVEAYLEHQGQKWCHVYDPNSMLFISKAMDLFSLAEVDPDTGELSLAYGLRNVHMPALIIGVQSDILFPLWQQQQTARALRDAGNKSVAFYTLDSIYGHDTFLIDVANVGAALKGHLEQSYAWHL